MGVDGARREGVCGEFLVVGQAWDEAIDGTDWMRMTPQGRWCTTHARGVTTAAE
jgi:hypothetical protein